MGAPLYICCIFSEHLFIRTPSKGCIFIWWIGHVGPCNNVLKAGSLAFGCFCFNIWRVLSVKSKIPFNIFSVKSLSAPLTFPLLNKFLNFNEILSMFIPFSLIFILFWIVSLSCTKLLKFPSSHKFSRLSSDLKWPFDFDPPLGF